MNQEKIRQFYNIHSDEYGKKFCKFGPEQAGEKHQLPASTINMPMTNDFESEVFAFFDETPDLVCIASSDGYFKKINRSAIQKLEYPVQELMAKPISFFIHPDDKVKTSLRRAELLTGKALINFQNRYISKTGKILWLDWTSIYLPDKEIVFAIAKDVTERKKEEYEIEEKYKKFKSLAAHFKTSIEKERKFLAMELHEELAQLAAVVKMDIDWIGKNVEGLTADSKKRFDHALGVSQLLINAIRRISYSISPQMLEDLGFNETLKWLCEEFSILNGIQCKYETSVDDGVLNREIQLDFFRICQEALSNIMYHAQANQVTISIKTEGDAILLRIIDDGKGFDLTDTKSAHGLTSIRERASSINAQLNIDSATGKGTRICITIPQNNNFPN